MAGSPGIDRLRPLPPSQSHGHQRELKQNEEKTPVHDVVNPGCQLVVRDVR
jgi:hypothetical protein